MRPVDKYFRYLWRINAVVIAVLGLAMLGMLLAAVFSALRGPQGPTAAGFAPLSGAHGVSYRLARNAIVLGDRREKLFVLQRWTGDPRSPDAAGSDVNLLVVDGQTASSHWMFRGNDQTILSTDPLRDDGPMAPVIGLVLTVSERIKNDGTQESLYCYRVGGGPAVRFFTAESIMAAQQVGLDRYLVVFRDDGKTSAETFSLVDFKMISKSPVPDLP
ncbi:MAG: hypothetical protein KGJ78_07020 [Alphaproteobacteria bacterium]|nr:hypothetical protein [Alphaproteobacteria bacterium]